MRVALGCGRVPPLLVLLCALLAGCGGDPPVEHDPTPASTGTSDPTTPAQAAAETDAALPTELPELPNPDRATLERGAALGGPDADDAQRIRDLTGAALAAIQQQSGQATPGGATPDPTQAQMQDFLTQMQQAAETFQDEGGQRRDAPAPKRPPSAATDADVADMMAGIEAQRANLAAYQAAVRELGAAGNDPDKRAAALRRVQEAALKVRETGIKAESERRVAKLASLPPDWQKTYRVEKDGAEADLLVQLGDIDNLGYGWPDGFDPFSGESTPIHRYPWTPENDDPPGTDRIMVISGFNPDGHARREGYTRDSKRPENQPQPLTLEFDADAVPIRSAALQLFVDDFQAVHLEHRFRVRLDGREAPDIEATFNTLDQTGPIGKLLTIQLLPEYLGLLADGRLEVSIDDPDTDVGDGFAFDFARLLINPKGYRYTGTVRGVVVEQTGRKPMAGVLVSAGNVRQVVTGADGRFELSEVPAGLVVTAASHPDYLPDSESADLTAGQTIELELVLARNEQSAQNLAERLERDGKVDLYGIYFDTDKAMLKPESEATLNQVLALLQKEADLRLVIAGHTDAEGGDDYNQGLSERRAASVLAWLSGHGIASERLRSEGHGEARPVADNASAEGRALNRRVEIRNAARGP